MLITLLFSVILLQDAASPRANPPAEAASRESPAFIGPLGDGRGLPPYLRNDPRVAQTPPDDAEWAAITDFMESNAPHRWSLYKRFEEQVRSDGRGGRILDIIRQRMAVRYRALSVLKQDQPDLYAFAVRQGKIEDQAIETLAALRANEDDTAAQSRIRQLAEEFARNAIAERETRIERLRRALEREEAELARDREDINPLVERVLARFQQESEDFGRMERIREWRERSGGRPPGVRGAGSRPGDRRDRPDSPPRPSDD